ncbi:MAG: hypothetical protein K8S55_03880 [Phycisphaerae bacterium]|nr:hypothetical protein [Phycisphaerae bacterium]
MACVIRERRLRGEEGLWGIFDNNIKIGTRDIDKHLAQAWRVDVLLSEFPTATQIINRALLNLSHLVQHPMDNINPKPGNLAFLLFCPEPNLALQLKFMGQMGVIREINFTPKAAAFNITPAGWKRIEELPKVGRESRQVFIAMWFDSKMDEFYEKGIQSAVKDAGYECKRIDNVEHNNKICDEIVAEIRKSRFVISDFTGQRGGVYFEAGLAMGLGLPVIWLVQKDDVEKLHFDTRQYNHIVYESAEDLKQKLFNRIAATIH